MTQTLPHRLLEPRSNFDMGFRAFERCAPRIYNKLPSDIKDCVRIDLFKKKLKTYLFTEAYDLSGMRIKPWSLEENTTSSK